MDVLLRAGVRLLIVALAGALLVSAILVAMAPAAWGVLNAHREIPVSLTQFTGLAERSVVFDVVGRQVGVFQVENTQQTRIDAVPQPVIAAFLAVEDANFLDHRGVNLRSAVRALLSNYQSSSTRQGASTITQQVVKNEFLAGLGRDGRYKILQARYATMLEKEFDKREILERYLNTVFFGNNAYGIRAAAEVYFGKRVENLLVDEGAFLAGLVQAPSTYDPIRRPDASRTRYKIALGRLVAEGVIGSDDATEACSGWERPRVRSQRDDECRIPETINSIPREDVNRTYFTEEVKDYLLNRSTILGPDYQTRFNRLFRGGLRIHTTLDREAQAAAEVAVAEQLPANRTGIQAAAVVIDNATGGVRAMVGGSGFVPGRNEVNLALRRRQTGSSAKIFILVAALRAGIMPDDVIDGTLPCTLPNPGNPTQPFEIKNGVSRGVSDLRTMTALSINCAYGRLSQVVGLERVVDTTYELVSSEWTNRDTYGIQPFASFATGANEMSPLDMASGAQTLASVGVHREPYMIERIEDSNGEIYRRESSESTVLTPDVALRAIDTLKSVLTVGTARRTPLAEARPAAGKTGTQADNTNAWFVGFTKQLSAAVWVGDPKGYTPMVNIPEFVRVDGIRRVQGSMYPARIWKQFMDQIHFNLVPSDWDEPPVAVPTVSRPEVGPKRIVLPGEECLARVVSGTIPRQGGEPGDTVVVSIADPGTTISPADRRPDAPVNTVRIGEYWVYTCARPFPPSVQTVTNGEPAP